MEYTEIEFRISGADAAVLPAVRDVVMALGGECGMESFTEEDDVVHGYAQQDLLDEVMLRQLLDNLPFGDEVSVSYLTRPVESQDWNATWEATGFDPIVLDGRLAIHDAMHQVDGCPIDIEINARQAFGTGTHETTRMIVAKLMKIQLQGKRVLDCGIGTGILSIAALKLGAASAVGYDIDQWSVDNAMQNAAQNGVADRLSVHQGDASLVSNNAAGWGTFDVVLANINRNILLADMPRWTAVMSPGATLVLSGFYADDVSMLLDRASGLGLNLIETQHDGQWTMLVLVSQ